MIYLDNGATTWPKPHSVLREMGRCQRKYAANPGRGGHDMAIRAGEIVYECRDAVQNFFGVSSAQNVIFTSNATHALNIAIKGIAGQGGHVVLTSMEHNSVLRPVHCTDGVSYDMVTADNMGYTSPEDMEEAIRPQTCLIICTAASNVCGSVQQYREIASVAKKHGIPFLLDASQGAGVMDINMAADGIDLLAAPGHKGLYGPMGTGVLCVNSDCALPPLTEGGTGSRSKERTQPDELPDRLESGTLNVPGISGLLRGVQFVSSFGKNEIRRKEEYLCNILAEDLLSIKGIHTAGYDKSRERIGVLSVYFDSMECVQMSSRLNDEYGIAVRAGYHCAYTAHETIGTQNSGTVRFSLGVFNTVQDVKEAAYAVNMILKRPNM